MKSSAVNISLIVVMFGGGAFKPMAQAPGEAYAAPGSGASAAVNLQAEQGRSGRQAPSMFRGSADAFVNSQAGSRPPAPGTQWLVKPASPAVPVSVAAPTKRASQPSRESGSTNRAVGPTITGMRFTGGDPLLAYQRLYAAKGVPESQYAMGRRHLAGLGVEKDEEKGLDFMRKAARQGHLGARAYLHERSVTERIEEKIRLGMWGDSTEPTADY